MTVTSCFVYKETRDFESIYHLCINPIRILSIHISSCGVFKLIFYLRGYIFRKLLLAQKFSCINKNCSFVKETDTFGHIVDLYISQRSLYAPTYSFWAIRSMLFSLFRVTSWFNTVYNVVTCWMNIRKKIIARTWTTIIRLQYLEVFLPKMYKFLVEKYIFQFLLVNISRSNWFF